MQNMAYFQLKDDSDYNPFTSEQQMDGQELSGDEDHCIKKSMSEDGYWDHA